MRTNDFACLILTHGRAGNVKTYDTLKRMGYTGRIVLVIDNEDEQEDKYRKIYGSENIYVFDKQKYLDLSDVADAGGTRKVILPARNACFDIANDLGLQYFLELDDDYLGFYHRYEENGSLKSNKLKEGQLDRIFDEYCDFLETSGALTVCFSQAGDFVGGLGSNVWKRRISRKAMNAFFCKTLRPFKFFGRLNDDVTTYVLYGTRGELMFTIADIMLTQPITQANAGGATDAYLKLGTYTKSFYSVIHAPSCVKISAMGWHDYRIHHNVIWNNCTPMIVNQKHQKPRALVNL